ncbi:MAG: PfkB family carbohydrate kinase, partial [Mycobacteriales bacterium]
PGGKGANQAVAAARAGGNVVLLGAVGADPYGAELNDFLTGHGVNTSHLVERSGVATGTAPILVDQSGENMIVVVPGANGTVDGAVATAVPLSADDVLVAQFETPANATLAFFRHGAAVGALRILNPAPRRRFPGSCWSS